MISVELRPGDQVVSRPDAMPDAQLTERAIEDVFIRTTAIWEAVVDGQTIGTTSEHPFWVVGRGWIPAGMLAGGERVLAEDGRTLTVESSRDAGRVETVYNFRVADDHTYFVGCPDWGSGCSGQGGVSSTPRLHHPLPTFHFLSLLD